MKKTYDELFIAMTNEIDWMNIRAAAKKILFYCIACAGFSLNISVPLMILFYFEFGKGFILLQSFIVASMGFFITFIFIPASMSEMTELLWKINFFRVYFYLLPKGFSWCVRKTLCALILSARLILSSM